MNELLIREAPVTQNDKCLLHCSWFPIIIRQIRLLPKISHILIAFHKYFNLDLTKKLYFFLLAFMVLEWAVLGVKTHQSSYSVWDFTILSF